MFLIAHIFTAKLHLLYIFFKYNKIQNFIHTPALCAPLLTCCQTQLKSRLNIFFAYVFSFLKFQVYCALPMLYLLFSTFLYCYIFYCCCVFLQCIAALIFFIYYTFFFAFVIFSIFFSLAFRLSFNCIKFRL